MLRRKSGLNPRVWSGRKAKSILTFKQHLILYAEMRDLDRPWRTSIPASARESKPQKNAELFPHLLLADRNGKHWDATTTSCATDNSPRFSGILWILNDEHWSHNRFPFPTVGTTMQTGQNWELWDLLLSCCANLRVIAICLFLQLHDSGNQPLLQIVLVLDRIPGVFLKVFLFLKKKAGSAWIRMTRTCCHFWKKVFVLATKGAPRGVLETINRHRKTSFRRKAAMQSGPEFILRKEWEENPKWTRKPGCLSRI